MILDELRDFWKLRRTGLHVGTQSENTVTKRETQRLFIVQGFVPAYIQPRTYTIFFELD